VISGIGKNILIKNNSGRTIYFDRELLQDAILNAAVQSESCQNEQALAEDISYAIEKYLETMTAPGVEMPELREVNSFVVNLLNDSGNSEVAHIYASMHTADWDQQSSRELKEWTAASVSELIESKPLFQSYDREVLARSVNEALEKLGFLQVSEALIVELGAHIINNETTRVQEEVEPAQVNQGLLLSAAEIKSFSRKNIRCWFESMVLDVRDISRVFPKLHIDLNFLTYVCLLQEGGDMALMELVFLPTLHDFVHELARSFSNVISFIENTFPDVEIPCFLTIDSFDLTLKDCFKVHGKQKSVLAKEIAGVIAREFKQTCGKDVKIVYIKEE
jgi:hypothetical protein